MGPAPRMCLSGLDFTVLDMGLSWGPWGCPKRTTLMGTWLMGTMGFRRVFSACCLLAPPNWRKGLLINFLQRKHDSFRGMFPHQPSHWTLKQTFWLRLNLGPPACGCDPLSDKQLWVCMKMVGIPHKKWQFQKRKIMIQSGFIQFPIIFRQTATLTPLLYHIFPLIFISLYHYIIAIIYYTIRYPKSPRTSWRPQERWSTGEASMSFLAPTWPWRRRKRRWLGVVTFLWGWGV